MKIVFAASSGGHLEQLMMLKPLMEKYDSIIVTEETKYTVKTDAVKTYYLHQVNRKEITFLPRFFSNAFREFLIIVCEKPDVLITTGVLAIVPLAVMMKIFGRKVIYIESFAKVTSKTLSGKLIYRFADQFYVQWKDMLKLYPNAIYKGGIY